MQSTRVEPALPLAIAMLALAACGGGDTPSKAGGPGPPVTVRIGTAAYPDQPAGDAIEAFVREVEAVSDRRLRIKPVWHAAGTQARSFDQRVAKMVVAGELDMGFIPARAWDTEGVTSLRALHAPFLVTTDELVSEVVRDDLGDEMLAGVEKLGLVGLALIPEGLRHPVGLGKPLVAAADYSGITVVTPRSATGYALFRALGATPVDLNGAGYTRARRRGVLHGEDSSFGLSGTVPRPRIYTGNVTLYPKVNSLVVNREAYEDLTEEQRDTLREAADRTLEHVLDEQIPEREAAERFCADGGTLVTATDAQLRDLERAAAPVYAELEKDAATRSMIDRIRELKQEQSASASPEIEPCEPGKAAPRSSPSSAPPAPDQGEQGIPNGVYRMSITEAELPPGLPPGDGPYDGVHTFTLENGTFVGEQRTDAPLPHCLGSYTSSSSTIELRFETDCSGNMSARWSLRGGYLHFSGIGSSEDPSGVPVLRAVFGTKPYRKID